MSAGWVVLACLGVVAVAWLVAVFRMDAGPDWLVNVAVFTLYSALVVGGLVLVWMVLADIGLRVSVE